MAVPADFSAFCAVEYPRLVRALSLYCGSRDVAEDAAQEALIRACERWPKVGAMNAPGAWTFRVATNHVHSHYRKVRTASRFSERLADEPVRTDDAAQLVAVRQAVASLPRRQRQALLRHIFGLTVDETADLMRSTSPAVRSLTHRAVLTLKRQLRDDDRDEFPEVDDAR
jgi:RNA polymerase sigma-70 factor (ECF subfamily)